MRFHRIRHNRRTRLPGAIIVVDTESHEVHGIGDPCRKTYPLRLGCASYLRFEGGRPGRRQILDFTDALVFWEWVRSHMSRDRGVWLWAHNLGWDLTTLRFWRELESGRFKLVGPLRRTQNVETGEWKKQPTPGHLITKDPPSAFRVWDRDGACLRACDTFNWYPVSLAKLGDCLGLKKLECDPLTAGEGDLRVYCRRDVEITEKAVIGLFAFIRQNDLGNLRYTPASQAFSAWRHLEEGRLAEPHGNGELSEWERRAYFGGKRYLFFRGDVVSPAHFKLVSESAARKAPPREYTGPVTHLDVNAAYATAMIDNYFPVRFERWEKNVPVKAARDLLRGFAAIAHVLLETGGRDYPRRTPERLFWNVGRFQTTLAGPELAAALAAGHVQHIFLMALYQRHKPFTRTMTRFLEMEGAARASGDDLGRDLVKLLRNSLHGKFGERMAGWEVEPGKWSHEPWGFFISEHGTPPKLCLYRSVGGQGQRELDGPVTRNTFVPIAAYTTAYCRERMRELVEVAGDRGVFYQNVDTLHVSKSGLQALELAGEVHPTAPGKLRVVKSAECVRYLAPGHYLWEDREVLDGVPARARPLPNGTFAVSKFHRLNWYLQGVPPEGGVVTEEVMESPAHPLAARPGADGWTTPLSV